MSRVLIANRGEIAVRVIRACHDLGMEAVAVYSDCDVNSLHVRLADHAVRIGPDQPRQSYLDQDAILAAARDSGADAVHPGYGFLSENADFARRVQDEGLIWVGPSPDVIEQMGDKAQARAVAVQAGVPVVPGTDVLADIAQARIEAAELGFPVLLKAAEGGGGKGIRVVTTEEELDAAYSQASQEVTAAFGSAHIYLEKALVDVRHIEVQILGDQYGKIVHLLERDCSLQRRRQKIVEEAPAPTLSATTRDAVHAHAVALARAMSYSSAGTVEFLVDAAGEVFFIEVNARIQVEHGITELITGVDVCMEQLRVAFGEPLELTQDDIVGRGHAIEVRVNAENPAFHFLGSPGEITYCRLPSGPGVRVDSFVETNAIVQPHYDSLIAKVMTTGPDRDHAVAAMRRALDEIVIDGVITTVPVSQKLIDQPWFVRADYSTLTLEGALSTLI